MSEPARAGGTTIPAETHSGIASGAGLDFRILGGGQKRWRSRRDRWVSSNGEGICGYAEFMRKRNYGEGEDSALGQDHAAVVSQPEPRVVRDLPHMTVRVAEAAGISAVKGR